MPSLFGSAKIEQPKTVAQIPPDPALAQRALDMRRRRGLQSTVLAGGNLKAPASGNLKPLLGGGATG
jgi:hypothetical protein